MNPRNALYLSLVAVAACAGRNAPVKAPVPASYDPAKNDPKALALIQKMTDALGGAAAWDAVRQLSWTTEVELNGQLRAHYHHDWDRWSARHRLEHFNLASYQQARATGDDKLIQQSVAMYPLYERNRGAAYYGKRHQMQDGIYSQPLPSDAAADAIDKAYARWRQDAFMLAFPFRLTEGGTYVKHDGDRNDEYCPNGCEVVAVTFEPPLPQDKFWINVDKKTLRPVLVEWQQADKPGRLAYKVTGWQKVGGLEFPTALDNVGARNMGDSEVWKFTDIQIGDPDDMLYIPQVR
ncbi:MAG: hypothetical protein D6689_04655 [Deltaproteobacteria bacterium]|nr:MAG: hypothetical protein D6689_04655 [Deltaproteobacteria bacterium]